MSDFWVLLELPIFKWLNRVNSASQKGVFDLTKVKHTDRWVTHRVTVINFPAHSSVITPDKTKQLVKDEVIHSVRFLILSILRQKICWMGTCCPLKTWKVFLWALFLFMSAFWGLNIIVEHLHLLYSTDLWVCAVVSFAHLTLRRFSI